MVDFLKENWSVVSTNPLIFLIFAILVGAVGFGFARLIYSAALEAARERLAGAKDEVARLSSQKDKLVEQLVLHGDAIEKIHKELDSMPRIRVSDQPPDNGIGKDGDLWIQTKK